MRKPNFKALCCALIVIILFILLIIECHQLAYHQQVAAETPNEVVIKVLTTPKEQYTFDSIIEPPVDIEFTFQRHTQFHYNSDLSLSRDLQEYTYYIGQLYGIEYEFLLAVMYHESGFNAGAISPWNDYGLMQINSICVPYLSQVVGISNVDDLLDPYTNIQCGAHLLKILFDKYTNPILVQMCYQYGEGGATALWEKGIHSTDYSYVVYNTYLRFKGVTQS